MNAPEGPLATLLALEARARRARDVAELAFVAVNETHDLLPYRQAALWRPSGLVAVSGVARPEPRAPFTEWIERLMRARVAAGPTTLDGATLGDSDWAEWLPRHALLLPFASGAAVLFAREEAFSSSEIALAEALADVWGHALVSLEARSRPRFRLPRRPALIALLLAAAGFLPVPLTVLVPASVVARGATVMRAPLDGVVERVHVQPNDAVASGQPLFDLDPTELAARLAVAEKAAASAEAERHQTSQ
ncbi:MAG: biotin/lipoyl-binding protein, partial [Alphaproteobacteria bacterium]|nr:biotin/lipoyl-binding protein [Alphaproteobacteria bacterium]